MNNKRESRTRDIFYLLGRAAILMAFLLLVYVYYLLFFPIKTIVFKNTPFPVAKEVLHRGEAVPFTVSYCKYTLGESQIIAGIADGVVITLGTKEAISIPGCHTVKSEYWKVPQNTPSGIYHLVFIDSFPVNQFRTVQVASQTQNFTVE